MSLHSSFVHKGKENLYFKSTLNEDLYTKWVIYIQKCFIQQKYCYPFFTKLRKKDTLLFIEENYFKKWPDLSSRRENVKKKKLKQKTSYLIFFLLLSFYVKTFQPFFSSLFRTFPFCCNRLTKEACFFFRFSSATRQKAINSFRTYWLRQNLTRNRKTRFWKSSVCFLPIFPSSKSLTSLFWLVCCSPINDQLATTQCTLYHPTRHTRRYTQRIIVTKKNSVGLSRKKKRESNNTQLIQLRKSNPKKEREHI